MYDFSYMRPLEYANSSRQKVEYRVYLGLVEKRLGNDRLMHPVSVWNDEIFLEADRVGGCTTL